MGLTSFSGELPALKDDSFLIGGFTYWKLFETLGSLTKYR